jgi:hypothetical protein
MPMTPMGAMNTGEGSDSPNISTDRSRSRVARSMRGTSP